MRKTLDNHLPGRWEDGGFQEVGGDPSSEGMILKWGVVDTPLQTMLRQLHGPNLN